MSEVFDGILYEEGKQYKDDDKLIVAFYSKPVQNNFKSQLEGRPIFEDVDFIKIIIPGQRDVTDTKANEGYKQRFPRHWADYKNRRQEVVTGTPLSELTWMGAAVAAEFAAVNVRTVEQLVGMSDVDGTRFMGFSKIKERCQRFLSAAKGEAPNLQMEKKIEDLERENKSYKEQMEQLKAQVKALETLAKKA